MTSSSRNACVSLVRTPLVVTLGPASFGVESALAEAGSSAFRLNASHLSPAELDAAIARARRARPELPIVIDLQGAKMRLGTFDERELREGDLVRFALDPVDEDVLPLPHAELFRSVEPGQTLSCDDDRLRLRVRAIGGATLEARCTSSGVIRPRKGVNLLEHPVRLDDLSAVDVEHLEVAARHERIAVAISFMLDGSEAEWVGRRAPGLALIGKVERRGALEALDELCEVVDALWICRGDLGAQLGAAELGRWVSGFRPDTLPRPVLMAGQVLEHLTGHAEPTRSEVCHLHDLARRGYAGIVLSDETAIGRDPVRAATRAKALWPVEG